MVNGTLVKLCVDHFKTDEIEAAKQSLFECEVVDKLCLRQGYRRQGNGKDKNNVEDILVALHMSPKCRIYLHCLRWMSTALTSITSFLNFAS